MRRSILLLPFLLTLLCVPAGLPAAEPAQTVVVLSTGEPLLAGSVEAYVERQLARRGFDVVDESGIPGLYAWLEERVSPEEEGRILDLLSKRAAHIILIEATYLGNRPLYYLNRTEPIFQARLRIRSLPFRVNGIRKILFDDRIEFTHLSVEKSIKKKIGPQIRSIVETLSKDQGLREKDSKP